MRPDHSKLGETSQLKPD